MHRWETLVLLKHLVGQKISKAAIARQLGVSRRIIYYWLATGQLERDLQAPPRRTPAPRRTKFDPFRPLVTERLTAYPALSAVRLLAELRAAGYPGGITQLRDFMATQRVQPPPEPVVRFETAPDHQAQVDFAEFRSP